MIVIRCPYCHEERVEDELVYGGEADVVRPQTPSAESDETWSAYLFFRNNPKGISAEKWCCAFGCGQWFKVARDTVSHEVLAVVTFDRDPLAEVAAR